MNCSQPSSGVLGWFREEELEKFGRNGLHWHAFEMATAFDFVAQKSAISSIISRRFHQNWSAIETHNWSNVPIIYILAVPGINTDVSSLMALFFFNTVKLYAKSNTATAFESAMLLSLIHI